MHADPTCSDIGTSCSGRLQHPLSRLRDGNAFPSQLVANAKAAGLKTFAYAFRSEVRLGHCDTLPPGSNCWATGPLARRLLPMTSTVSEAGSVPLGPRQDWLWQMVQ